MFNKILKYQQKELDKQKVDLEKWRKEQIGKFEDWCRENNTAVIPELTHRDNPFGGLQGLQVGLQFYPLTDEQVKKLYPQFQYRTPEESAEAIKNGEIKIDKNES